MRLRDVSKRLIERHETNVVEKRWFDEWMIATGAMSKGILLHKHHLPALLREPPLLLHLAKREEWRICCTC